MTVKTNNTVRPRWAKALDTLLDAGCYTLAEVPGPNKSEIRFMCRPDGRLIVFQTFHAGSGGFEIYRPVGDSNKVEETIKAALA